MKLYNTMIPNNLRKASIETKKQIKTALENEN